MSQVAAGSPEADAGLFGWLAGTVKTVANYHVTDYLTDNFPERVPDVDPTAPQVDDAVNESNAANLAEKLGEKQNTMIMLGVAGVLSAVLLVSVLRR